MDRAIDRLGAKGVQIVTSVAGRPLDDPEFFPVFQRMANHHDRPIWMHPARPANRPDYPRRAEVQVRDLAGARLARSRPASPMARMVVLGAAAEAAEASHHHAPLRRHDPYFAGRAETLWAQLGSRSSDNDEADVLKQLGKPPIEYFKMFYGDTCSAVQPPPLACGIAFFGPDHVVFASDCPFDPEGGPMFIREGIRSSKI
jgi:aminocarboxymuconate-semialdehyde decarboxylase